MNVFKREMKAHRKSLIIWSISMLFLVGSGMSKFAVLSVGSENMNALMAKLPKSMQTIFGTGSFDLSKASGFYGMLFLYIVLMSTIHAAMIGSDIISKEERDKTSEFLFVKPISRNKIISQKLLAGLLNIIVLNIITLISSIAITSKYSKGETVTSDIILLMLAMFILQLVFLFVGTGLAAISKNPKTAVSATTGILLFTYILSVMIDMNSSFENLMYITPFKYFEAKNIMYGGGLNAVFVTMSVFIIAILLAVTYIFYKKRDLSI